MNIQKKLSVTSKLLFPAIGMLIAVAMIAWAWSILSKERPALPPASPGAAVSTAPARPADNTETSSVNVTPSVNTVQLYREQISPLIDDAEARGQQSAERAIRAIHGNFLRYRAGVEPFIDDITSWGHRFGIVGRAAGDLWDKYWNDKQNPDRVAHYVTVKFNSHILTDRQLERDLSIALNQFHSDLEADRNRLFSEMKLALSAGTAAVMFEDRDFNAFLAETREGADRMAVEMSKDSVILGTAAFGGGFFAGEVVEKLIRAIMLKAGATVLAMATPMLAAGSSVTASAMATGGVIGISGGPVGTVAGIGSGIVVGLLVDWWATEALEAKLRDQCNSFLIGLETAIVKDADNKPGLRSALAEAVKINASAQREAILAALSGGAR